MHKILALAQNIGVLSKYRRQMYAANVGVKCMRISEIYAANVGVQSMQNCEITAPHNKRQKQGGGWNLCGSKYMRQMYASIRKLAPKLLLFGLGRISNFWILLSLAEELSLRWCCLSCMQSSSERWTACMLLLFAHSLPYCTGCCTGTTCQNICALSKYLWAPIFWEFSPIFRGRLLSSQNSNQRAVKEKVVHFWSPLSNEPPWDLVGVAVEKLDRRRGGDLQQINRWSHRPCAELLWRGEGGVQATPKPPPTMRDRGEIGLDRL